MSSVMRAALSVLTAGGMLCGVARAQSVPVATASPTAVCNVTGRVSIGTTPVPGAIVAVDVDGTRRGQALTDSNGAFTLRLAPNGRYHLSVVQTFFQPGARDVATADAPCDQTQNFALTLAPRAASAAAPAGNANGVARRGTPPAPGANGRFAQLNVAETAAPLDATAISSDAELATLLPPGFSADAAASDAVAISGNGSVATLDRRMMNERFDAIERGDLDPATGVFAGGGPGPLGGGPGGFGGPGGQGGPGGFGGPGGPGGPGGRGFVIGGRPGNQNGYHGSATYTFGGSALDAAPYQLRPDAPAAEPQSARNNFGVTIGGPFKIPGLYQNTARRSSFQANYNGSLANNIFNRYATVPTDAMRAGDFSASPIALIDPLTGQAFPGNQIPQSRWDSAALSLLSYLPHANLPGTAQNYQITSLAHSSSDDVSVRFTQNLSPASSLQPNGRGRGGFGPRAGGPPPGGAGGFGPRGGPGGAPRGPGAANGPGRPTTIMLNAQLQLRHGSNDQPNVFPDLASRSSNTSLTAPISLNIIHGRSFQDITVNIAHTHADSTNDFSSVTDAAGLAGIAYPPVAPVAALNWGVPNLNFSTLTGLSLAAATERSDDRLTLSYSWMHPLRRHQLRVGGSYRLDRSSAIINSNARGAFQFTGLYTAPRAEVAGASGADFADFLLGMPQQASLQSGGTTHLRDQQFAAFLEDNWRANNRLTINAGVRYELVLPYTETGGRLTNLDAASDFSGVAAVVAGGSGPYTGSFPNALIDPDFNNIGPRVGIAYRVATGTVLRGGYSITYNNGTYAQLARQLASQPPFSATGTVLGSYETPLFLQSALLASTEQTTNNWGVDRTYALGMIQTWNAAVTRDLARNWTLGLAYTGTKGNDLDILRAPNRGPDGLRIDGVQPFIWESSEGHSLLNSLTAQVRRRLAGGVSAAASYTLAKSMDNASSLGAGATVVAQNDQDLDAEWGRSNFDRRHQFTAQAMWELPWGVDRRWLSHGGVVANVFGDWNLSANFSAQSGTPYTVRVIGAASDAARGTSGSLRANYNGAITALDQPSIAQFFNVAAFSVPAAGTFGTAGRNTVTGPGSEQLNAQVIRDVRLGRTRSVSISLNANNVLNTVQWAAIDTNLNSPTFGQVVSVRPMRSMTASLRVRF